MIRCNNCYTIFDNENDLTLCRVDEFDEPANPNDENFSDCEIVKGCHNCMTDSYLMDIITTQ